MVDQLRNASWRTKAGGFPFDDFDEENVDLLCEIFRLFFSKPQHQTLVNLLDVYDVVLPRYKKTKRPKIIRRE